jgi:hypothetical protein
MGTVILSKKTDRFQTSETLQLKGLPSGVYQLILINKQVKFAQKLIIQ